MARRGSRGIGLLLLSIIAPIVLFVVVPIVAFNVNNATLEKLKVNFVAGKYMYQGSGVMYNDDIIDKFEITLTSIDEEAYYKLSPQLRPKAIVDSYDHPFLIDIEVTLYSQKVAKKIYIGDKYSTGNYSADYVYRVERDEVLFLDYIKFRFEHDENGNLSYIRVDLNNNNKDVKFAETLSLYHIAD